MPTYLFQGRNSEGELISGKRIAQSEDNLGNQLIKEGVIPIKIYTEEVKKNAWQDLKTILFRKKITSEDLAIFSRQMYTLIKAGVPLSTAIRQLAESSHNPQMTQALLAVVEFLEAGQDLAGAMQNFPEVFTPLMISMVRVGQNSGKLDEIFNDLYEFLELEATSIKRTKAIMRYPMFVMIALTIAIVIINVFVIPTFANVYARTGIKLPYVTELLIKFSQFFIHHWFFILVLFVSAIVGFLYYIKTPIGKLKWHKYMLRMPIAGKILNKVVLLRFAQAFAVVVNSGVPLVEGLSLVAQSIQNEYIRSRILVMHEEIQRGKTLTQAAATANIFNPLELQMLSISEETGSLGLMLEQIAGYYQREVDYDLKRIGDTIEPLLIFVLSMLVLGLALAVYLPIWNMVKIAQQ